MQFLSIQRQVIFHLTLNVIERQCDFGASYIYSLLGPLDYTPCHRETQTVTDRREVTQRQQMHTSLTLPAGSEEVCWASVATRW